MMETLYYGKRYGKQSLNIPVFYKDELSGTSERGYIGIDESCRGIWMGGQMNEEKRTNLIAPIADRMMENGWDVCICDNHYPLLTEKLHLSQPKAIIHTVNFGDAMYSDRINILHTVSDTLDALQMARTIVSILYRGQRAYFEQSIIKLLAAGIWLFSGRKHKDNDVQPDDFSLPHILAFFMEDYKTIFDVLMNRSECREFTKPFQTAYDKKDYDQLEGMVADFRVKLAEWCTYHLFWVGSGEDFTIDFTKNESSSPRILIIAANPDERKEDGETIPMGTLLLNTLLTVNEGAGNKRSLPLGVVVDDMEMIYIHNLDRLFGTMRYNKIALALGFQKARQLERDYGEKERDAMVPIIPTFLSTGIKDIPTWGWLKRIGVINMKNDIPDGYIYSSRQVGESKDTIKRMNAIRPTGTKRGKKYLSLKISPRFTDQTEMDYVLKENYNRIIRDVKAFCQKYSNVHRS